MTTISENVQVKNNSNNIKLMNAKLIIFDFGGTLDTNGVHWSELFWEYYQKYKIEIEKSLFEYGYVGAQKFLDASDILADKNMSETIFSQMFYQDAKIFDITTRHYLNAQLIKTISDDIYAFVLGNIKNAITILDAIKKDRKTAIVSNFNGNLKIVCDELRLTNKFDYLIDSTVVNLWKPDPKIFDYCLKQAKITASDCVVIGDSYSRDITPAKSIGAQTIWLNKSSWDKPENTSNADIIINSINELLNIL